jgi:hypothetical protein
MEAPTTKWNSIEERSLYRQTVLDMYGRFRNLDDHPDGKCRTERIAFLLRQDITKVAPAIGWVSTEERTLYRQTVFNMYGRFKNLEDHPDGFVDDKQIDGEPKAGS